MRNIPIDPLTISAAISTATAAFGGIKRAFAAGRELDAMVGDLSKWMGAVSDVANIEKRAKNPSILRKVFNGQSVEQEALEAFTAKKKLQQQRDELRTFISFSHGTKAWDELIAMEGQIRKRRQKEVYEAQESKEKIIMWTVLTITFSIGIALLIGLAYALWLVDRS